MCDTVAVVRPGGVLFAKNSDRDANEAQVLAWHPAAEHAPGAKVRCTWIEIPQSRRTHAVLLSRPFWMWGAEMGVNEHGVALGNEAVFTRQPRAKTGLTGMDLLRLALERAASAREAVDVLLALLGEHGQGGGCGHEDRAFSYHNSFLVADARGAFVLETAGKLHALEEVRAGARTISNVLTIPGFDRHSDAVFTGVACGRVRRARSAALAGQAHGVGDLFRLLRDHGEGRAWPRYRWHNGAMAGVCAHAGGALAATQTTASLVAELRPDGASVWATGTAAPCVSLFKPVRVGEPVDTGPEPTDRAEDRSLWWRHERLHRALLRAPERLAAPVLAERDAQEAAWLASPPAPAQAFARADALLRDWTARVQGRPAVDERPWWARRYWRRREARAAAPG